MKGRRVLQEMHGMCSSWCSKLSKHMEIFVFHHVKSFFDKVNWTNVFSFSLPLWVHPQMFTPSTYPLILMSLIFNPILTFLSPPHLLSPPFLLFFVPRLQVPNPSKPGSFFPQRGHPQCHLLWRQVPQPSRSDQPIEQGLSGTCRHRNNLIPRTVKLCSAQLLSSMW